MPRFFDSRDVVADIPSSPSSSFTVRPCLLCVSLLWDKRTAVSCPNNWGDLPIPAKKSSEGAIVGSPRPRYGWNRLDLCGMASNTKPTRARSPMNTAFLVPGDVSIGSPFDFSRYWRRRGWLFVALAILIAATGCQTTPSLSTEEPDVFTLREG